jgi:hypothetical protein
MLLVGPALVMADAAYFPYADVMQTQSFDRAVNNHTYVYAANPAEYWYGNEFLVQEESAAWTNYQYLMNTWDSGFTSSGAGPAERAFNFDPYNSASWGWLSNSVLLPNFFDFTTPHPDTSLGSKQMYRVFPLAIGESNTLLMDSGYIYIGTFNVTSQEFFHMTTTCHQDNVDVYWFVYDYNGRGLVESGLEDGDIEVSPFPSVGNGTYYLIIGCDSGDTAPVPVDILIESVVPEAISFGAAVEGNLPGSELVVNTDQGNSFTYQERRPNVFTYKVSTNSTEYGCLSYALNYPESMTSTYNTRITITSNKFVDGSLTDYLWEYGPNLPSDSFYYTSFANETYYITVQGMDNTDFMIFNQAADLTTLPVNQAFFIQNWQSNYKIQAYKLNLGHDAVLRLNRTEWNGGFSWSLWTIGESGKYEQLTIPEGGSFASATTMLIPAGRYIVTAISYSQSSSGIYEFNMGPIVDGAGNVAVDSGSLVGIRVPVQDLTFYRTNVTLTTHDNVTVSSDIDFLNMYGGVVRQVSATLGNRQTGTSWAAYGSNKTSIVSGFSTAYDMFCDGDAIIVVAPYQVLNNTGGGGGNQYHRYTANFKVTFEDVGSKVLTADESATVGSGLVWHNFTLSELGDSSEIYALRITVPAGRWLNISTYADDVNSMTVYAYQDVMGCPTYLSWNDLQDTMTGSMNGEGSFQFGSISTDILLVFSVSRTLGGEGYLNIGIRPLKTNTLQYLPLPNYYNYGAVPGPAAAPLDPALVIGGVAVVAVVVVVVVFVLRRQGRI